MPAPFSASSTLPIAALLASDASRAVLASDVTPASICARSGATDTVASPVTEIIGGGTVSRQRGRGEQRGRDDGGGERDAMLHEAHFSGT